MSGGSRQTQHWTCLSNIYIFQTADKSHGDRASLAGEKLALHEEREERLKTTIVEAARKGTNGGHLRCQSEMIYWFS